MGVYIPYTRLPSAYQEVEWIGTKSYPQQGQYIDTGVAVSSDLSFDMKILVDTSYYNNKCIFGSYWSTTAIFLYVYNSHYRLHYGGSTIDGANISSSDTTISVTPNSLTVNGSTVTASPGSNFGSGNMWLFISDGGHTGSFAGVYNIYYLQIKKNGTLIRDFVPCYRKSDGVIGLYDLVNDQFYTNAGAGTFSKGNDVNMTELKNAYIGEYGWKPGANTLLYLPFSTDLNDHSGNSHNPSTYSSASITTLNGVKCCYFNDGAMEIPQFTTFNHSFTISLWYNITNVYGTQIANQGQGGTSKMMGFGLQAQRGRIGFGFYGNDYETTTVPATNTWVHIVATFNRDTNYGVIYYNGNSIGAHTYSTPNVQSGTFYIGPNAEAPSSTTWRMRGYVSNYIVENKARTAQEIANYYNLTKGSYGL